jgi:hypothetical protein
VAKELNEKLSTIKEDWDVPHMIQRGTVLIKCADLRIRISCSGLRLMFGS